MSTLHILVADDHDFTRSMEVRALRELGITRITEARNGEEALKLAVTDRPDIVISDLNMPGMDGMTFIGQLAKGKLADSLIIASGLSKQVLASVEAVAVASGLRVLGAIEKPLGKDAIASLLHAHANPGGDSPDKKFGREAADRAIALRQFKAWFMPVIELASMKVIAAEATPHWESASSAPRTGPEAIGGMLEPAATRVVARAVAESALATGGLWRQMGYRGAVHVPVGAALLDGEEFVAWFTALAKKNGLTGGVSIVVDAAAFTQHPAEAAIAVARCAMDGVGVIVRVRAASDFDALTRVALCSAIWCPHGWTTKPDAMKLVREFAARTGAAVGAAEVPDAAALQVLGAAGVRWASGPAVGAAGSAAGTYDTHLAGR